MKNLVIITLKKTYDSLELDKFTQTKRFDISDKSPFVEKYWIV